MTTYTIAPTWHELDAANKQDQHYGRGKPSWLLDAEAAELTACQQMTAAANDYEDGRISAEQMAEKREAWEQAYYWRLECGEAFQAGSVPYSLQVAIAAELAVNAL